MSRPADRESGALGQVSRSVPRRGLAWTLGMLGAFAEGRHTGRRRSASPPGRPREHTDHCPRLPRRAIPRPRRPGHAIRVFEQGLALCRTFGERTFVATIEGVWAMPLRSRDASWRGARCWRRRSAKVSAQGGAAGQASWAVCAQRGFLLAGRDAEAWQHAREALDLARSSKSVPTRRRAAPDGRGPCPRQPL